MTRQTVSVFLSALFTFGAPLEQYSARADESRGTANAPDIWPQWRGPNRDGRIDGLSEWPDRLAEDVLEQAWRVELAPSYSGPIVSENRVFVTETTPDGQETVRALDRSTGSQSWERSWAGKLSVPFFAKENGDWIRATPALDEDRLYVAGMRDVLTCLDATTGEVRWRVDFVEKFQTPLPAFGFVSSPLVDGNFVYVQAGASVVKLDKRTGHVAWRTLEDSGGMFGSAFSSPVIAEIDGIRQLIVQSREKLGGVDLESGKVLWSREIPAFRGMNILTPTVVGDSVFTSAYGGKSLRLDVYSSDGEFTTEQRWTNKSTGYMSSPVVFGDHLYMHLRNQRFSCIEIESGKTRWTTTPYGKYWSLVGSADKLLALDERGELLLIRATPEKFELLDTRKISDEPTWAHLAVVRDEIFIRELNAISAYRWRSSENSVPAGKP